MTVPIKTLPDTREVTVSDTSADLDPHVAALATGDFAIEYTTFGGGQLDGNTYSANGSFVHALAIYLDGTSNDRQPSVYGLDNGDIIGAWMHVPTATGDGDILARLVYPNGDSSGLG